MQSLRILFTAAFFALFLSGCAKLPPEHPRNACKIFKQYPTWYWSALKAKRKWGVPLSVQLAIIHQESHFRAHARPPREKLLGFIPWARPTSADGYTQAIDETWQLYLRDTGQRSASRTSFASAVDFIGWYANYAHNYLGISRSNAYAIYLAYHEGVRGYLHRTYRHKSWLLSVAQHVQHQADIYRLQLLRCQRYLPKMPWWRRL